jgi:hypothetical protein
MTPIRLAFVQEFERQLTSYPLRQWFETARSNEAGLQAIADPDSLRRFLHSEEVDARKPEIWRALVNSFQLDPTSPARLFIVGLLEPVLGHLTDSFDEVELDPDDLWQETVASALEALRNPKLPKRREVLAGLVKDTYKYLCIWLRDEFAKGEQEAPLLELSYEVDFENRPESTDLEILLAHWCLQARVDPTAVGLIRATRLDGKKLSRFAPARSPAYDRLRHARSVAERRLEEWLLRRGSSAR